ncbi:MAG: ATP-binding cassette domain-containing protein, partial [Desulfovibrionaceae bacterium]|nr:ATP-binding cassette domain-containing protein [Desulfovibrionaceae bacterium]
MMLQVSNLNIYYGRAQVVFDTSFEVQAGEFVGLFGRNGSGKSSLFRALMGLYPPSVDGKIAFQGRSIVGLPPHAVANLGIGWVPEDRKIFPNLTIQRNLLLGEKAA